jgi:hypothetical protein
VDSRSVNVGEDVERDWNAAGTVWKIAASMDEAWLEELFKADKGLRRLLFTIETQDGSKL